MGDGCRTTSRGTRCPRAVRPRSFVRVTRATRGRKRLSRESIKILICAVVRFSRSANPTAPIQVRGWPAHCLFRGPDEGWFILDDEPALHHEADSLHLADVGQRVS